MASPNYDQYGLKEDVDYGKFGLSEETHHQLPLRPKNSLLDYAKVFGSGLAGSASQGLRDILEPLSALIYGQNEASKFGSQFPTANTFENLLGEKQQNIQGPLYATEKLGEFTPMAIGIAGGLSSGISKIPRLLDSISPNKYAQQLLRELGGIPNKGSTETLTNNSKSLAKMLNDSKENQENIFADRYENIFNRAGNSNIINNDSKYNAIDKKIFNKDIGVKELNDKFIQNPTVRNAHELQSQLGAALRKYQGAPPEPKITNLLNNLGKARDSVKSDIASHLGATDPALLDEYELANADYRKHFVPYTENPTLWDIANGVNQNPRSSEIKNIFQNPNEGIKTILSHLGPDARNKILYSQLGGKNVKADQLSKKIETLDKSGFEDYINPYLEGKFSQIPQKIQNLNTSKKLAKNAALGTALAFGVPTLFHELSRFVPGVP